MSRSRVLFCLSAVLAGLTSAWLVVRWGGDESVTVGAWRSEVLAGSVDAGPYTRARVALGGLLALGPAETLYFVAEHDDAGQALRANCPYRVEGPAPQARWWSVTAYGDDRFLLAAPEHRYSVNSSAAPAAVPGAVPGSVPGKVSFVTGPVPSAAKPWLPTPGGGGLLLVLRLYQPGPVLRENLHAMVPLRITAAGDCQ